MSCILYSFLLLTSFEIVSQESTNSSRAHYSIDITDDFEHYAINEYEDPVTKIYHCSVKSSMKNNSFIPDPHIMKYLDSNGLLSIRPRKNYYQVRQVRQKLCKFGFDPFRIDKKQGSIHKRFKNNLRLMIYNTPGMFPNLKVVRNDLDRRRKREPQIWLKFETSNGPLSAEFDYDNYFILITGDLARIQAFSKMLVAVKLHKRLNNFHDPVSYKVNLDLGIVDVILSTFGFWLMRDKTLSSEMLKALNGIRTIVTESGDVNVEFEKSMKEATDKIDSNLYSYIWLLSLAEKFEVIKVGGVASSSTNNNNSSLNVSKLKSNSTYSN
ncbi:uncharacterized protein LOC122509963 [Leptopilina heterotoma]|uniref:uncharacterized protein LOC122509963 n=1 Tax=Leptopilina heterotoma TaxID=63436 RepID=UPI001CA9D796|nr:uncharacterized protein LOC122509963 [Leptopilina heterotoma]XP_043480267.1 uncharacterized protein LOC122509963 [Leptopilina heterotoma]XP_043480271.1 uncharacterized protein LOC122509963 [Leptopilina heterotoma]XP_043480276.1 uncharacterized protein LOC122509963 [Leptopilina heterotoma]XP_043480280.1 uncharacterized protein LOC122509963 [Leptopilina heterotoma]XP_043480286.1 uncharacterized protein LOC122509963 [Leptopilina heterotoma]XP_043480292.1 uncharacterized protein LOC122509963 [